MDQIIDELRKIRNLDDVMYAVSIIPIMKTRSGKLVKDSDINFNNFVLVRELSKYSSEDQQWIAERLPVEDFINFGDLDKKDKEFFDRIVDGKNGRISKYIAVKKLRCISNDFLRNFNKDIYHTYYKNILLKGIEMDPNQPTYNQLIESFDEYSGYEKQLLLTKYLAYETMFIIRNNHQYENFFKAICSIFLKETKSTYHNEWFVYDRLNLRYPYVGLAFFALLKDRFNVPIMKILSATFYEPSIERIEENMVFNGGNDYAFGIDIHSGKRDFYTKKVLKSFFEEYVPNEDEIPDLMEQFWNHYDKLDENYKAIIVRCLGIYREIEVVRNPKDFGGLYSSRFFPNYSFYQIISAFVNFCNKYQDEQCRKIDEYSQDCLDHTRKLALEALFKTLYDTYDKDHIVCDPGKFQRLVSQLLSGRYIYEGKILMFDELVADIKNVLNEDVRRPNFTQIKYHMNNFFTNNTNIPKNGDDLLNYVLSYACDLMQNGVNLNPKFLMLYLFFVDSNCEYSITVRNEDGTEREERCIDFNPEKSLMRDYPEVAETWIYKLYMEHFYEYELRLFENANPLVVESRNRYIEKKRLDAEKQAATRRILEERRLRGNKTII